MRMQFGGLFDVVLEEDEDQFHSEGDGQQVDGRDVKEREKGSLDKDSQLVNAVDVDHCHPDVDCPDQHVDKDAEDVEEGVSRYLSHVVVVRALDALGTSHDQPHLEEIKQESSHHFQRLSLAGRADSDDEEY